MPVTDRNSRLPRAAAIIVPLLLALSGCAAALLPQLATMSATQAVPCAGGAVSCGSGLMDSMIQRVSGSMQRLAPVASRPPEPGF